MKKKNKGIFLVPSLCGYVARNPGIGFKVVDFISSYLPGTPASSYSGVAGFTGSYVYGHEKW